MIAVAGLALTVCGASAARAAALAVVVHPDVDVDDLTLDEFTSIALAERQFWSPGRPITLIVRSPVALERTLLLGRVYQMSEAEYRRFWIGRIFRGETSEEPRVVLSNEEAIDLVSVIDGAISLVDAADVPAGLKILKIDGRLPDQAGYPFADGGD